MLTFLFICILQAVPVWPQLPANHTGIGPAAWGHIPDSSGVNVRIPPAFAGRVSIRGYVKELAVLSLSNNLGTVWYDNIVHQRLETRWNVLPQVHLQADLRNRLISGRTVRTTPGYGTFLDQDPGYVDLTRVWADNRHAVFVSQIDRLHLSFVKNAWEVHLGRQRMNWGKTMVWNPNDLFNAYAWLDFDYEERPGTDALHIQYTWGYASGIEFGYRIGNSVDRSVMALIYRGSAGSYDVQVLAGNYFTNLVLGAGWSGYLSDAGFKGEISYFQPRNVSDDGHLTATIGAETMFSNGVFGTAELLYNGGWKPAADAVDVLVSPPSASNLFISDTGYFVNVSGTPHPLISLSTGLMGSFTRSLFILIPQAGFSLAENLDLLVLMQQYRGSVLTRLTDTPNVMFLRVKWSY